MSIAPAQVQEEFGVTLDQWIAELTAALHKRFGLVVKYSDDEPRDGHGRWTSGGGAAEATGYKDTPFGGRISFNNQPSTWATEKEARDGFLGRHDISLSRNASLSEKEFVEKAKVLDKTMTDLSTRFPGLYDRTDLGRGRVSKDKLSLMEVHGGIELTKDLGKTKVSDSQARTLGTYRWQDGSVKVVAQDNPGKPLGYNDWTVGGGSMDSVLRHELGHSLDMKLNYLISQRNGMDVVDPKVRTFDLYKADMKAGVPLVSKYAATNEGEWLAESFSAYTHPDYATNPKIKINPTLETLFNKVLKTSPSPQRKTRARKYSDDEPRDGHGRWTSGGGAAEATGHMEGLSGERITFNNQPATWRTEKEARDGFYGRHNISLGRDRDSGLSEKAFVEKAKVLDRAITDLSTRFPGLYDRTDLVGYAPGHKVPLMELYGGIELTKGSANLGDPKSKAPALGTYYRSNGTIRIRSSVQDRAHAALNYNSWTVTANDMAGTLRHEIGHSIETRLNSLARTTGGYDKEFHTANLYHADVAAKAAMPSIYSKTNAKEWLAESFAAYTHPDYGSGKVKINPTLETLFDKVLKVKSA